MVDFYEFYLNLYEIKASNEKISGTGVFSAFELRHLIRSIYESINTIKA
jgi:hypothetical protein